MILYVEDYFSRIQVFIVKYKSITLNPAVLVYKTNFIDQILRALKLERFEADGIDVHYLLKEIKEFNNYRKLLCRKYSKSRNTYIKIVPPKKEPLDYKGNYIAIRKVWEKVEIENLMSWLSTLGGGFSALGENFINCAKTAGRISLQQLELGIRIGDPFVQARCKLYFSISLIQIGKLKTAANIIREQYNFAKTQKEIDHRLVKMCQGIWLKLQYAYMNRRKNSVTRNI